VSRFVEVAVFTEDVVAVRSCYELLLGTAPESEWPGGALFVADGVKLLVHARSASAEGGPPNEDHVAIAVGDLDAACAALRGQGIELLVEPRDYPWGRSAYLRDPDGRLVELSGS
jgi:catechol 2,3-dioxygenase-like lactoylglutathione lyase family enzyme